MMDLFESINAGVVNRERKVKAWRLKEDWKEAKRIMVGVRSSRWSAAGGRCSLATRRDGWSARKMIDTWYN